VRGLFEGHGALDINMIGVYMPLDKMKGKVGAVSNGNSFSIHA
jgi:hypothetical protein